MMRKLCIGILAHGNQNYLTKLVKTLLSQDVVILIHIDGKFDFDFEKFSFDFKDNLEVNLISERFDCNRKYFSIVEASNSIILESLKYKWDVFCLISGADCLVKSSEWIESFFWKYSNLNFMEIQSENFNNFIFEETNTDVIDKLKLKPKYHYDRVPSSNYNSHYFNNEWGYLSKYYFNEKFDYLYEKMLYKILRYNYLKKVYLNVFRRKSNFNISFGSAWFNINRDVTEFLAKEIKNDFWKNHFKYTLFPSEAYYQTIISNYFSQDDIENNFVNSDLRYVNWNHQEKWRLLPLSTEDIENATKESIAIFARKVW